ncbi:MAG: 3-hydroxyacyl-CoA dehydrogenase [Saprospiraceae bacterium]|jgi:3-hydroxyacyl-CoA dehydrogenase
MKNIIKKVAVLGAGVMGAQVAAHLANSRVQVILFDLPSKQGDKSSTVDAAIKSLTKLKPAPLATDGIEQQIISANYDEDLDLLKDCDLIIEAIAEKMEWKKSLYDQIEPYLGEDTLLASNTSGLSINELSKQLAKPLRKHFLGVHFFNPPRYMHLLEMIPCEDTDESVIHSLESFFVTTLGKGVVIAKDTPNFIGNRIGVFSMLATMAHATRLNIPFEVVDQITGKPLGRPKSGTFRTADVVGLDTMMHVINTLQGQLPNDPWAVCYQTPDFIESLVSEGSLGQKTRKGIYINKGKQVFSVKAGDYVDADHQFDERIAGILKLGDWSQKIDALRASKHPHAQFIWACLSDLFHYCLHTLEEIALCARDVDFAIRWGFGWDIGPFEIMQQIGFVKTVELLNQELASNNLLATAPLPAWTNEISDIHNEQGSYSASETRYVPLRDHPVYERQAQRENVVSHARKKSLGSTIFENDSVRLWHGKDDIAVLSYKTKMNTINSEVLTSIPKACMEAEKNFAGLIIWQPNGPFGVGADLKEAALYHAQGHFDMIVKMVEGFQDAAMALRHCYVPTVAAVQGLALGGACEFQMHCHRTVAAQETYTGLVEAGVGLMPAGGGLKELALRSAHNAKNGDLMPHIQSAFEATAMAKVSASGLDAKALGLMVDHDVVIANSHELLHVALSQVKALSAAGFRPPSRDEKVPVMGKTGKANLMMMAVNMLEGHFISPYDYEIAERIATTLCGGEVETGTLVSQDWLLKLERDNFIELLQQEKTQERIEHTLKTGKPLRN